MTDFTSGGFHGLYYVEEVTWGTTPLTPPMTAVRHFECDLNLTKGNFMSKELRSDRAIVDSRHGVKRVEGGFSFEISYEAFDDFLEAVLGGTWTSDKVAQGVTKRYFSILRRFSDITQFMLFSGCAPNIFTLEVKPEGMIEGKFSFIGKDMTTTLPTGLAYTGTAPTYSPMDSFTGTLQEGGSPIATITAISLSLENGLEPAIVVGSNVAAGISWGRSKLTGKVSAMFDDLTLYTKFVNETETSIEFELSDGTRSYTFLMDRVKYNAATADVKDEKPVVLDMPFDALHDAVYTNLQITRAAT